AVAGVYQTSRRADSTVARLSALTSELWVRAARGGTLTMIGGPFPAGQSFHSVGEARLRGSNGSEVAFDWPRGREMRLSYGPPLVEWQRVPPYLDFRVVAPALLTAVAIGVLTLAAWPIAAILRWRQGRRWSESKLDRRYHIVARLVLALQISVIA